MSQMASSTSDNLWPCQSLQDEIFVGRKEAVLAPALISDKKTPASENHPRGVRAGADSEDVY